MAHPLSDHRKQGCWAMVPGTAASYLLLPRWGRIAGICVGGFAQDWSRVACVLTDLSAKVGCECRRAVASLINGAAERAKDWVGKG